MTATVLVLYAGGTIGMVPSDPGTPASPLRPAPQADLIRVLANPLNGIRWHLEGLADDRGEAVGPIDSSSAGPDQWRWMAQAIARNYAGYDGFVILHGTDTLAYSASALSFLLHNLAKPVIVTGAQMPIFAPRGDAVLNFANALCIAGWPATGLPCIPEVMVCFADTLLRGNRATKVSTTRWRAFDSPNYPHLGRLGPRIEIDTKAIGAVPDAGAFAVHPALDRRVMTVTLSPGLAADQLRGILDLPTVKGYVLRTFGAGNVPEQPEFLQVLADAVTAGKIIVAVSQCPEGRVEAGLYAAGSGWPALGVINGLDLTTEAALTKLMWLLAIAAPQDIPTLFRISHRGEQAEPRFDLRHNQDFRARADPM